MKLTELKPIIDFLKANGFEKMEKNSYANDLCNVLFEDDYTAIANQRGDAVYNKGFDIYWIIGILTYFGYMNKNYKQLNNP